MEEMPTTIWMSSGYKNHAYYSAKTLAIATLNQRLTHIIGHDENNRAIYGADTTVAFTENFPRVDITHLIDEYMLKSSEAMDGRVIGNLQVYNRPAFITLRNELEEKIMQESFILPEDGRL